jgi:hypothetical protein
MTGALAREVPLTDYDFEKNGRALGAIELYILFS